MTNDKTVTMSPELVERLMRAIDEPQPSPLYAELKSLLANHSEEPLGVVEPAACNHEWTDDGEFLLVCTACGAQENHDPQWRDMETAPKDGTLIRLLVEFDEHSTEDDEQAPTIGANNFENDERDEWLFAGWCWTHDHWVQGKGTPIGWLPMIDSTPAPVAVVLAEVEELQATIARLMAEIEAYNMSQRIKSAACKDCSSHPCQCERLKGGPAAVVLPDRMEEAYFPEDTPHDNKVWNACLDKVKELNQ